MVAVDTSCKARTSRRGALRWLSAGAVMLAVTAIVHGSIADSSAAIDVELTQIHGTNDGAKSIPADWPELGSPPWNTYSHYDVVPPKSTLHLTTGAKVTQKLADGSTLEATLLDEPNKGKIEIVLKDGGGGTLSKGKYPAGKGAKLLPFSVPYQGGNLVAGLKVQ